MILLYNTNATLNPNAYLTLAIEECLRRLVGREHIGRVDERTLAPAAATGAHELLICLDGQRLDAGLIARVRPAFRRVVLWSFEDPFMLDYNLAHLELFDLVFTNDPSCVAAYKGRGHFLPLAGSPMLHRREVLPDDRLRYDIFFAGTMWPNRIAVLRRIIAAFPSASMRLVCPTNEYLPPLAPQIADRALTRPISHSAFIDFANASRVTLTLFRDYASHGQSGLATAPGPRLFELGLAGTAQVVQRDARMPAAQFDGLDGISIESGETMIRRIGEILADPALRDRLARSAQAAVLASHGYEHRLGQLLELSRATPPPMAEPRSLGRLRVLMCTHSTVYRQHWGGVEVYQQMLCRLLEREIEAFLWVREDGACRLLDAQGRVLERFDAEDSGWLDLLCDPVEEAHFSDILVSYAIDVVHFQHLGHHAASLPLIARACGVGTLLSVHDFFLVCARYNLLDHQGRFCDIGNRPISACATCLGAAEGLPAGVQQQRRGFIEQLLGAVDLLLFGSRDSEALVLRIYPQARGMRRLVLGIPSPTGSLPRSGRNPRADRASGMLEVMVVGNFLRTKGAETILQVIAAIDPLHFRFHILGLTEPDLLTPLQAFGSRVVVHGRYAPGELSLGDGQVALHLSIWPETWCISLSEVWEAGLIPIVTDIGALGERVTHGVDGFKVRVGDVAAVLDLLEILRSNPDLRARIRSAIGPHLWTDAAQHSALVLEQYRTLAPRARLGQARKLAMTSSTLHLLTKRSWKELATPRHILDAMPGSFLRIELPSSIAEWVSIQGCKATVDCVCGSESDAARQPRPGERVAVPGFAPAAQFSIKGWIFAPGTGQSGQVFICLVHTGGRHVVFLEAERTSRPDVHAMHPDAPLRSGYAAQLGLAGKWADGSYAIGLIMVTNGQAGYQMSPHEVSFLDGKVVELAIMRPEASAILRSFACVFSASPLAERFIAARRTRKPAAFQVEPAAERVCAHMPFADAS